MNDSTIVKMGFKELNEKLWKLKNVDNGVFGGIHEKYWVACNNKQYVFKYNQSEKDYSDFGEVFTSYLSLLLGFKCVKSVFCKDLFNDNSNICGVLVESYRTKDVLESVSLKMLIKKYKRRHFPGYTVRETFEICKEYAEENNLIIDKNLEQELKEMAVMDYLLIQVDRHPSNIEFLIKNVGNFKQLTLAPMFDNGFSLFMQTNETANKKILTSYKTNGILNKIGHNMNNPKPQFYIEKSKEICDDGECIVRDLASELLKNKPLRRLYEKFLELDFEEELNFVNKLKEKPLLKNYFELAKIAVKYRVKFLNDELLKQEIKNSIKEKDNYEHNFTL